ncbi:MAG: SRPBCC family protein [Terracidiphilus sp.]
MAESEFVYVTYIRTTPEKLWRALLEPEFTRQYWMATVQECAWKPGASWKIVFPDGRVADSGEVVEIDPPRKLVLKWKHELFPELTGEGYARMTYNLEQQGDMVKLTLLHEMDKPESKFIKAVGGGWPIILASLKSLLETGESLEATRSMPKGM